MTKRNIIITSIIVLSLLAVVVTSQPALAAKCAGVETSVIECSETGQDAIFLIIKNIIYIMTAGVGILSVAAVIYGAILYSTSGSRPDALKKAKEIWMNVVIGLLIFAFLVAITNFIIPGGVFG